MDHGCVSKIFGKKKRITKCDQQYETELFHFSKKISTAGCSAINVELMSIRNVARIFILRIFEPFYIFISYGDSAYQQIQFCYRGICKCPIVPIVPIVTASVSFVQRATMKLQWSAMGFEFQCASH